jgi:hypothetical protein
MEMIGLARVEQKIDNNEGYTFEATKLSAYYTLKSGVDSLNLVGSAITLAGDPVSGLSLKGTSYAIYAGVEVAAVVTLKKSLIHLLVILLTKNLMLLQKQLIN